MAKFKVGDKVVVKPGRIMSGETGVVVKVGNYPVSGGVKVDVKMKDGSVVDWTEDEIVAANAVMNLKFKVGDKVKGTMGASPMGVITKIEKSDSWLGNTCTVKWDDGTTTHPCEGQLMLANSCRSTNSVVRNAMAASRKVARNADIYSLVKQEFKAQYPYKDFGIDMRLEPNGKFKIWEVGSTHGPNDSSGVDWKRIAAKVKSAMGSQISSIKATPYDNGVEGVMARNAYGANPFKAGDRVKWRYRKPMTDDYTGWNEDIVERVNGDYIHIKGLVEDIPWKGHEGIEVLKNACAMNIESRATIQHESDGWYYVGLRDGKIYSAVKRGPFDSREKAKAEAAKDGFRVINACGTARNAESEKYFEKHLSDILAMMRKVRSDYQQVKKDDAVVKKLLHDAEREFTQAGYDRNTSNALGRLAKEILATSPFGLL